MTDPLSPAARRLLEELLARKDARPGRTVLFSFRHNATEVDELKARGIVLEVETNLAMLANSADVP
jgi:hypothetical protein